MKKSLKKLIGFVVGVMVRFGARARVGRYFFDQITNSVMSRTRQVRHGDVELAFSVPNGLSHFRVETFATKEPETLAWIDGIPPGSIVWDIGANIGLYTCYAAKKGCRVFAFEPSVFNLELLARNIFLNRLVGQVTIVPLALSDVMAVNIFNMTSMEQGGAMSTFGQSYGHDGRELNQTFGFQTLGVSMMDVVELLKIPQPDYIKMDVDGIEHLILKGGKDVLRNAQSVLIEINEDFEKQFHDSAIYLHDSGFLLTEKRHAEMFENSEFNKSYNQIWCRATLH